MSSERLFLSLKVKIAITAVAVIFALSLTRMYITYQSSITLHQKSSVVTTTELGQTFIELAKRSGLQLERLASQLNTKDFFNEQYSDEPNWFTQHMYSGIETVQFFNANGSLINAWSTTGSKLIPSEKMNNKALQQVVKNGAPVNYITCQKQCLQSAYVPVITSAEKEIIVSVSRSVADVVRDFKNISKADIILFTNNFDNGKWYEQSINSATNPDLTPHILFELDQGTQFTAEQPYFYGQLTGKTFAAKKISFDGSINYGPISAIVVVNLSKTASYISQAVILNVAITLAFLVVTAFAVWLVLRRPLNDLANLASALPKLAEGDYQVIEKIVAKQHRSWISDELGLLQSASIRLSQELQDLEYLSDKRFEELQSTIKNLESAENFNQEMADACPIIIALQKPSGELLQLNHYGREKLGFTKEEIEHRTPYLPQHDEEHWHKRVKQVLSGKVAQSENVVKGLSNESLEFLWLHTALKRDNDDVVLSVGMDVTERNHTQAQLAWLHEHDSITGLVNRQYFTQKVEQLLTSARQSRLSTLILAFDIVDFSEFNEQYGFVTGDELLRNVAELVQKIIPKGAICCRIQADQFCVFCLSADPTTQADTIFNTLSAEGTFTQTVQFTAASLIDSRLHANAEELINNVLEALYSAKTESPGKLKYLSDENFNRNIRLEAKYSKESLLKAFDQNRLVLYYQPIVDAKTGIISHCESLVRMLAEDGRILAPFRFLETAKRFSQMTRLDLEVMRMAMIQQQRWEAAGKDIKLSINITAPTFEEANFITNFQGLLAATGANPKKLILEIVETDAIASIEKTQTLTTAIKAHGTEIAFDDFGVGFTSFEYLRELTVDYIKIDQSFIRQLTEQAENVLLVQSMINMARALNKKVVAEGVEDKKTALQLIDMEVDYLQGYYFGRPSPDCNFNEKRHIEDFKNAQKVKLAG